MMGITPPDDIRTERLYLRPWRESDAPLLAPILDANVQHLAQWIPAHVASPAPLVELTARLAAFSADARTGRSWRFAIFSADQHQLFGEVSLFFRSAAERVALAAADRLEIGYWLRQDVTGRGYATEAARAMLSLANDLGMMKHVEIRCDPRNESSAAVPMRLGFHLAHSAPSPGPDGCESDGMIWIRELTGNEARPMA